MNISGIVLCLCLVQCTFAANPNLVWMVSDDMYPFITNFISEDHPLFGKTTNLDHLQENGVTFTEAHAQQTTCGPSRSSFLSGRYPETTKIYNFDRYLLEVHPDIMTIPKYFKSKGYKVQVFGKVFHPHSMVDNVDSSRIYDVYSTTGHYDNPILADDNNANTECKDRQYYCWDHSNQETDFTDRHIADSFDSYLDSINDDDNFMVILGLRRPHSDYSAPQEFYNQIDMDKVINQVKLLNTTLPNIENVTDPVLSLAKYKCDKMKDRRVQKSNTQYSTKFVKVVDVDSLGSDEDALANLRRGYFASILFLDYIVGRIRDSLTKLTQEQQDNTIIMFSADHGLQNGEKGLFCKNTLYDIATKVPLIISGPGIPKNVIYEHSTQLIDIFPSIMDAFGEDPNEFTDGSGLPLDGESFYPALQQLANGTEPISHNFASYTLYPRCNCSDDECGGAVEQNHPCTKVQFSIQGTKNDCERPPMFYMGYSIRTKQYRYTEWRKFNENRLECTSPTWMDMPVELQNNEESKYTKWGLDSSASWSDKPMQRELYYYDNILDNLNLESLNLAYDPSPENLELMESFSAMIRMNFQDSVKPCSNHGMYNATTEQCTCETGYYGFDCSSQNAPTTSPTQSPLNPTTSPTLAPTSSPSLKPTEGPHTPTSVPTDEPTVELPSASTPIPTKEPTTLAPTVEEGHPSSSPTRSTPSPTLSPSAPTTKPTQNPTLSQTEEPTHNPTKSPTVKGSRDTTGAPSSNETAAALKFNWSSLLIVFQCAVLYRVYY